MINISIKRYKLVKFKDVKETWKKTLDDSERRFIKYIFILIFTCLFIALITLLAKSYGQDTGSLDAFMVSGSAITFVILMIEGPRFFDKVDRRLKYQQDKQNTIIQVIREITPTLITLVKFNLTDINGKTFNSDIKKLNVINATPEITREKREIALSYLSQLLKLHENNKHFNFLEHFNQNNVDLIIKKLQYQVENLEKLIIRCQYSFFNDTDYVFRDKLEDLISALQIEILDSPQKLEMIGESDDVVLQKGEIIDKKTGKMIFKSKEEYLKQMGKEPLGNYLRKLKAFIKLLA